MTAVPPDEALRVHAGLCETCRHARRSSNARASVFIRCSRSETDPAYPKYPRLPVLECRGYEKLEATEPAGHAPDTPARPR